MRAAGKMDVEKQKKRAKLKIEEIASTAYLFFH